MNRRRAYRIALVIGWAVVIATAAWAVPHRVAEIVEANS